MTLIREPAPVLNRLTPAVLACLSEFSALYDSLEPALERAAVRCESANKVGESDVARELKLEVRRLQAAAARALAWNRQRLKFGSPISVEETEDTFEGVAHCLQTVALRFPSYRQALSAMRSDARLAGDTSGNDGDEICDRLSRVVHNWQQALPTATALIHIASVPFVDVEIIQRGTERCWAYYRNDDVIAELKNPPGKRECEVALKFAENCDSGIVSRDVTLEALRALSWSIEEGTFVDASGVPYAFHVSQRLTLRLMPEPSDTWRKQNC